MEKTKEEIKAAILKLRQQVIKNAPRGEWRQRTLLLAYGYIRGRAYSSMERTTNARSHCAIGKKTYYHSLAMAVASRLLDAFKTEEPDPKAPYRVDWDNLRPLTTEVMEWMRDHWDVSSDSEEAA